MGVIRLDGGSRIKEYIEKPVYNYDVSMGIYAFEPRILEYIPKGEYFDFPSLVQRLLGAGETVRGYPFDGYWLDIGRPDDYQQALLDFEAMRSVFLLEEESELGSSSL